MNANTILRTRELSPQVTVHLVQGDILVEPVQAVVNPANAQLAHGGGLAALIARRGGMQIQSESDAWVRAKGAVSHERPAVTGAGELPFRNIIHAVGPVWGSGDEDRKLASTVHGILDAADELSLETIALPAISTGIFGFPKERAASVIIRTLADRQNFPDSFGSLQQIRLVVFDAPTVQAFTAVWDSLEW